MWNTSTSSRKTQPAMQAAFRRYFRRTAVSCFPEKAVPAPSSSRVIASGSGGNRWEPVIWNPRIRACRSSSTRISPAVSIPILTAVFENSEPAGASFGSLHAARSRALHRIGSKK